MEDDFLDNVATEQMSEDSIKDDKPFEFGIRLEIDNFSKVPIDEKIFSPPCIVHNLAWRIMIKRTEQSGKSRLGYFLVCDPDTTKVKSSWSCEASARLYIMNREEPIHHFTREIRHLFCSGENDWGYTTFCSWDYICDPRNKYILNDSVKFDVCIVVDRPEGVDVSYNNFVNVRKHSHKLSKDRKTEIKNESDAAIGESIKRIKFDVMTEVDTLASDIRSEMRILKQELMKGFADQLKSAVKEIKLLNSVKAPTINCVKSEAQNAACLESKIFVESESGSSINSEFKVLMNAETKGIVNSEPNVLILPESNCFVRTKSDRDNTRITPPKVLILSEAKSSVKPKPENIAVTGATVHWFGPSKFGVEENISSYSDGGQHRSPAVSGESTNSDTLGVGSVVEVVIGGKICYGVIKWIGKVPLRGDSDVKSQMAGIELEEENEVGTNGWLGDRKYFACARNRGYFCLLSCCQKDSRFADFSFSHGRDTKISAEGKREDKIEDKLVRLSIEERRKDETVSSENGKKGDVNSFKRKFENTIENTAHNEVKKNKETLADTASDGDSDTSIDDFEIISIDESENFNVSGDKKFDESFEMISENTSGGKKSPKTDMVDAAAAKNAPAKSKALQAALADQIRNLEDEQGSFPLLPEILPSSNRSDLIQLPAFGLLNQNMVNSVSSCPEQQQASISAFRDRRPPSQISPQLSQRSEETLAPFYNSSLLKKKYSASHVENCTYSLEDWFEQIRKRVCE